jgi:hypothetical protein
MPPPFKQIRREQFVELVTRFDFRRKIDAVHMHHTWRPNHSQYDPNDGHRAILGMFLHHTRVNKWQDIAQHITIAPDGTIWLGRNWNLPPASAAGHNGNKDFGPFMFEIIGDFDAGHDKLEGPQRETVIDVIAQVQKRFALPPETLRFHNSMSTKSCPGTSIDRDRVLDEVRARIAQIDGAQREAPREVPRAPFPPEANAAALAVQESLAWFGREVPKYSDPPDAEPDYEDTARAVAPEAASRSGARGPGLTPEKLTALRPHLVNLTAGKFSTSGEFKTDQGEVDAIFDRELPIALDAAERDHEPLRIVFFAHGGLVKESSGLEIAHKHLEWWTDNHVYAIYFVWETGLFETIGQLLSRAQTGARNFVSDRVTDPLLETIAHVAGGVTIWNGMKSSAEMASATPDSVHGEGGAHYVARKLKEFCEGNAGKNIELHAVGHSAGAIFHAHFLSAARTLGVPSFKSAHFLAPAIRVDLFKKLVVDLIGDGKGIDRLCVFTMHRDLERDDNCAMVYRKSLLYLIYFALEPEPEEPILGLEQSLRRDPELRALFALDSPVGGDAEVVFSTTPTDDGRSASRSITHGGFDDDGATMNSVVRRVLGKADADPIVPYPSPRGAERDFSAWNNQVDWPERTDTDVPAPFAPAAFTDRAVAARRGATAGATSGGRRRALCVGINQYPGAPLSGCVADAEDWARAFGTLGFDTELMRDGEATRAAILRKLGDMLAASTAGDVIVFQFAGHGTQFPDLDGDEEDGPDEAMVPYDYGSGAYLIDDDVRDLLARIPDGVNMTCFFDCCHSGTNTRFAIGKEAAGSRGLRDERRRFMPATPEMKQAHEAFRRQYHAAPRAPADGREAMKNVAFSACLPNESAWESDGHGDFTLRATRLLRAGIGGMTNEQFGERISAEFGPGARQRPLLDCSSSVRALGLLMPLGGSPAPAVQPGAVAQPAAPGSTVPWMTPAELKHALQSLIDRL